ncbi:MAG: YicC/YloC family endoribonuclease [Syntrophales bacterium]|nr:YicC/YloC family endoribonuclease [Syntrophales bacterium]
MVRSMTGYGRAEAILDGQKMVVEIKSLNHRFLEISLRIPASLSALEMEIKKKIAEPLLRGKIEATIRRDAQGSTENGHFLALNLPLAQNYYNLLTQLKQSLNLKDDIRLEMIAAQKDVFLPVEPSQDMTALWQRLAMVLDEALAGLMDMRRREGEILVRDLSARLDLMALLLNGIEAKTPRVVLEYQRRLTDRVREMTSGLMIDEARLSQEVAIFAEKSDITEEIVRFRSHLGQFQEMLNSEDAIGRKVDFLIQEMNREVNTLGSKSSDADISRQVIEIKSELAKLREQVQNLE